ncbi:tetratricopeptide repeat protein [Adhaeribacter rhizoryzae]|uniref:tetratricopeptide repeat protein n=1 Tax=Adhaeribacter rhizoryzae TaxID=2607907 RepID=UPI00123290E4|nr:tetratricopeptide repeat protein [Adhaeribacter rhizoryzae]
MLRTFKFFILGLGTWLAVAGHALASLPSDELLKEANRLYLEYKDGEALQKFELVLTHDPNNYEALYKLSLLDLRIGTRFSDETQKNQFFTSALDYAQKALAVNANGAYAHYAMAAALNNLSVISGVKERMVKIRKVKEHLDKALALNPMHAEAWQLLGRWHYKVANLNFFECTASKLTGGGMQVGASNYKAIQSLNKSIQCNPANISSYYDLAIIYRDMKNTAKSVEVLERAITLQLVTSDDLELSRRCKALLHNLAKTSV